MLIADTFVLSLNHHIYRQAVSMLAAVEFHSDKWNGSDQEFLLRLCDSLMQRLKRIFDRFIVSALTILKRAMARLRVSNLDRSNQDH